MEFIFENKCLHKDQDETKMSMSLTVHTQETVHSISWALIQYGFPYVYFLDTIFTQLKEHISEASVWVSIYAHQ